MQRGKLYILLFAAAVCGVFSIVVSASVVLLKDRQEENLRLDRIKSVLRVSGLVANGAELSRQQALDLFSKNVDARLVVLKTGDYATSGDPASYDQKAASVVPATSSEAPANPAGVRRIPKLGLVYLVKSPESGQVTGILLPVEGKGLWSTLYGYLALEADLNTIKGVTFYQHGETPGLGGEVDNQKWKDSWKGKKLYDAVGKFLFHVKKGIAGSDPNAVDGLSGATLTSRGVTNLVQFWLGENGYGPFLKKYPVMSAGGGSK